VKGRKTQPSQLITKPSYHTLHNEHVSLFLAITFGDPHVTTLDGLTYTFNGLGEYWLMQTTVATFEFQARTGQASTSDGDLTDATVFTAFAVNTDNGWIQVRPHAFAQMHVILFHSGISHLTQNQSINGSNENGTYRLM